MYQTRSDRPPLSVIANVETQPNEKISVHLTGPSVASKGKTQMTVIILVTLPRFVLEKGPSHEIIEWLSESFAVLVFRLLCCRTMGGIQ